MTPLSKKQVIGVAGVGTMGTGIAQVAAAAGHRVLLFDAQIGAAERAAMHVWERVRSLAEKGKLELDQRAIQLTPVADVDELSKSDVVVEAVVEDLAAKRALFTQLEAIVTTDCVLASNTSSISPTSLAALLTHPERLVGLHFFNPVPVMGLVEVVPGLSTSTRVVESVSRLAESWGKTVVRSTPTPGFIVNRVARPFYSEAWRIYEEGAAEPATIDAVFVGAGGFRMGPFALMDLIGHDVNESVTRSVWAAFGHDTRFAPSLGQRTLVEGGRLGRKSGRGVYGYSQGATLPDAQPARPSAAPDEVLEIGRSGLGPLLERAGITLRHEAGDRGMVRLPSGVAVCRCNGRTANELSLLFGRPIVAVDRTLDDSTATAIAIARSHNCSQEGLAEAVGLLQAAGLDVYPIDDTPGLIVTRTVSMLANVAIDAVHKGVASPGDIDTAMRLGTNYPIGPLEWGQRWGPGTIVGVLDALDTIYRDGHYRASVKLRQHAVAGTPLI